MLKLTKRQKQYLGGGAAIAAIFVSGLFLTLSWSTDYNYCVSHKGQHATGQYNYEGSAIIEPMIDHPTAGNLFLHCGGIYANQNAGAITAAATVLLMLITGGLVVLGYMQFTTTRAQLRAYVGVDTAGIADGTGQFSGWPWLHMIIKNTGQTPARNVRSYARIDVGSITDPTLLPLPTGDVAGTNIASGGTTIHDNVWMHRQLAASEIVAIQGRTLAVYVYGLIQYVDVFGIDRETNFRLFHTGSWPPTPGTILYFAPKGNSFT